MILNFLVFFMLRLVETITIFLNFGNQESLYTSELIGLCFDFIGIAAFLVVFFPAYYFTCKISVKAANSFFLFLLSFTAIINFLIVRYFLYQLVPLDTFLYQYSWKEIFFTIRSAGINYLPVILIMLLLPAIICGFFALTGKIGVSRKTIIVGIIMLILAIPAFIVLQVTEANYTNKFSKNKFFYFFKKSFEHFTSGNKLIDSYNRQDAKNFQQLYPMKVFTNIQYPLLHEFENDNPLGSFNLGEKMIKGT